MLSEMGLIQLYSTPKVNSDINDSARTSTNAGKFSFCRCQQLEKKTSKCQMNMSSSQSSEGIPPKISLKTPEGPEILLDTCRCGEDTCRTINWTWDHQNLQPQTIIDDHTVQFHPIYSQGEISPRYFLVVSNINIASIYILNLPLFL